MQGYSKVVQTRWNLNVAGSRMFQFQNKLKNIKTGLLEWMRKENTNSKKQIDSIKMQMERMSEEGVKRIGNLGASSDTS